MRDFREYFYSLWKGWEAGVTGGSLAIFLTVWAGVAKAAPPSAIIFSCLALYFLIVPFGLWRKERHRALKAEQPPFSEEIAATIISRLSELNPAERRCMRELATGISANDEQAKKWTAGMATQHGKLLTRLELKGCVEQTQAPGVFRIDRVLLAAYQQHFKDHPLEGQRPPGPDSLPHAT